MEKETKTFQETGDLNSLTDDQIDTLYACLASTSGKLPNSVMEELVDIAEQRCLDKYNSKKQNKNEQAGIE